MKRTSFIATLIFSLLILLALSACNMPRADSEQTPTLDVTQAYQTVAARLTQAATQSPVPTATSAPTSTQPTTGTPTGSAAAPTSPTAKSASPTVGAKLCDQADPGTPIDVTIPDDTQMQPGQTFTKVWRLRNSGTCTWTKDYRIAVFSGEPMGAPDKVSLPNKVDPGQSVDITVDLVAPGSAGTYQGNWKLQNATGVWFGIGPGGSSPFWVRIKVVGEGTITPSLTPTGGTPTTPSVTPVTPYPPPTTVNNPPVLASGNNTMALNTRINLDANQVSAGGDDLRYDLNAKGKPILAPMSNVSWAGFGGNAPNYADCSAAALGGGAASLEDIPNGLYICYRTNQGHYGWLRIVNFNKLDGMLSVQVNTWAQP